LFFKDDEFQSGEDDADSDESFDDGVRDHLGDTPRRKKSAKAPLNEDSGVSIPFVPNSMVQQEIESSSQCHCCKQVRRPNGLSICVRSPICVVFFVFFCSGRRSRRRNAEILTAGYSSAVFAYQNMERDIQIA
jgi:hypothetical protein